MGEYFNKVEEFLDRTVGFTIGGILVAILHGAFWVIFFFFDLLERKGDAN